MLDYLWIISSSYLNLNVEIILIFKFNLKTLMMGFQNMNVTHNNNASVMMLKKTVNNVKMKRKEKFLLFKLLKIKRKLSNKQSNNLNKSLKISLHLMSNSIFLAVSKNISIKSYLLFPHGKKLKNQNQTCQSTLIENFVALSLIKRDPKAYKFLRQFLVLPAPSTLIKLMNKSTIKPVINHETLGHLRKGALALNMQKKLCVLMFDEIAIQADDQNKNFQPTCKEECVNQALLFMIRGLKGDYSEPVAYIFSKGASKPADLAYYIKEIIKELQYVRYSVIATVCDQASNKQKAIQLLVAESRAQNFKNEVEYHNMNVFIVNGHEIFPLFDPRNLLIGIANHLYHKDLKYISDGKNCLATWKQIEMLSAENPSYNGNSMLPKLSEFIEKSKKMKRKCAYHIFNLSIGTYLGYLAESGILPKDCCETAEILLIFTRAFNLLSASRHHKTRHSDKSCSALKLHLINHKLWRDVKTKINSMKFINKDGKEEIVPSLRNWLWTIEGVESLLKKLQSDHDVGSIWGSHLNQDPLRKFIKSISQLISNSKPSSTQIKGAFTKGNDVFE